MKLVKQQFFKILVNKVSYVTVDKQVFNFGLFWERSDLLVSLTLMASVDSLELYPSSQKIENK